MPARRFASKDPCPGGRSFEAPTRTARGPSGSAAHDGSEAIAASRPGRERSPRLGGAGRTFEAAWVPPRPRGDTQREAGQRAVALAQLRGVERHHLEARRRQRGRGLRGSPRPPSPTVFAAYPSWCGTTTRRTPAGRSRSTVPRATPTRSGAGAEPTRSRCGTRRRAARPRPPRAPWARTPASGRRSPRHVPAVERPRRRAPGRGGRPRCPR